MSCGKIPSQTWGFKARSSCSHQGPAATFSLLGFVRTSWQVCYQLVEGESFRPVSLPRLRLMQNQFPHESTLI